MNILALDTSMGACSAAVLAVDGGVEHLALREAVMARGHAEALMPMVAEAMGQGSVAFADLDVIAATTGPGSFTGVRIAIAAARGLALVTQATLYGTDSLTVMARLARAQSASEGEFAIAVDARRGMLYLGVYDAEGRKLEGPLLLAPDEAETHLPANLSMAAGSGAALLAEAAARAGRKIEARFPELQPSAGALAQIAYASGERLPNLRPLYLRPPDALPQAQALSRR
jgi:tRNA threonylcarbamoyl adenosine modification protein YeaZ